jgi:hypothetical protein
MLNFGLCHKSLINSIADDYKYLLWGENDQNFSFYSKNLLKSVL